MNNHSYDGGKIWNIHTINIITIMTTARAIMIITTTIAIAHAATITTIMTITIMIATVVAGMNT